MDIYEERDSFALSPEEARLLGFANNKGLLWPISKASVLLQKAEVLREHAANMDQAEYPQGADRNVLRNRSARQLDVARVIIQQVTPYLSVTDGVEDFLESAGTPEID
jgi:hypothetical protein